MKTRMRRGITAIATLLLLALSSNAKQARQEQSPAVREINVAGSGRIKVPDLLLSDQDGRKVRFYSDLIHDKVVVLNFVYTSCYYRCTRQGKIFSDLQSLLGERLGKSVILISVTTDPAKDTPAQLKAWSKRFNVQPGWTLVTGDVPSMNSLLLPFTGSPSGGGIHLPATFIGNDKTGKWISGSGNFTPQELLSAVDFVTKNAAVVN
jgi:protein SCO1